MLSHNYQDIGYSIPLPKIVYCRRLNLSDAEERSGIGGGKPCDFFERQVFYPAQVRQCVEQVDRFGNASLVFDWAVGFDKDTL